MVPRIRQDIFIRPGMQETVFRDVFIHSPMQRKYGAEAAPGVERMLMLLRGEDNIRVVTAFPMSGSAQEFMCSAPRDVTEQQLREVHIRVRDYRLLIALS